jgi:hypothetical protein
MRRVLGLLAAIGLLATFPTTVAAAEPLRASDWQTGIICELSSDAGFVSVFADVRESGAFADVAIWGPDADPYSDRSGSLALHLFDGIDDEVTNGPCGASTFTSIFFSTNPNAYLTGGDQLFISCEWVTKAGATSLLAINDEFGAFSELVIGRGDGVLVGLTVPTSSATMYQASYELFDPAGDGETVGLATADATLAPSGERITDQEWVGPYRLSTVGERLAADGTLTLSIGGSTEVLPMDDASCRAGDVQVQVMEKIPHG